MRRRPSPKPTPKNFDLLGKDCRDGVPLLGVEVAAITGFDRLDLLDVEESLYAVVGHVTPATWVVIDGHGHEVKALLIRPKEANMAVIVIQTLPDGVPIAMLDAVTKKMDVKANPPSGLIVHTHYQDDGRARVMDVWESEQAFRAFQEERLIPAMQQVASENGMELGGQPEHRVVELHDVVRGN